MAEKITLPKVLINKGSVYRLAKTMKITKGEWYVVVTCKKCGKPIYLLNDPFAGLDLHRFVGEGRISTPCRRCHKDAFYNPGELTSIQSDEDADYTQPRVEPSNMPRQPVLTKYPDAVPTFGPGQLEDRPKAAAIIARCISLWTEVEVQEAMLLAEMLRANTEPSVALFLAIHNSRIQHAVLDAVANVVLNQADYLLYSALMRYRAAVEKERHSLAHGSFGSAVGVEEAVLWVDPLNYVKHGAQIKLSGVTESSIARFREYVFVYELGDLETIARDMEHLHMHLGFFTGYLSALYDDGPDKHEWRAQRYVELCAEPRIAQELSRLKDRK